MWTVRTCVRPNGRPWRKVTERKRTWPRIVIFGRRIRAYEEVCQQILSQIVKSLTFNCNVKLREFLLFFHFFVTAVLRKVIFNRRLQVDNGLISVKSSMALTVNVRYAEFDNVLKFCTKTGEFKNAIFRRAFSNRRGNLGSQPSGKS